MTLGDKRAGDRPTPDWLIAARDRLLEDLTGGEEAAARGFPSLDYLPAAVGPAPRAGEIRPLFMPQAENDLEAPVRLVLVRHVDEEARIASVALVGHQPALAGGTDVVLPAERTGLPHVTVVETDVVAPAWLDQLGEQVGSVDEQTLIGVLETEYTGVPTVPNAMRGAPVGGPADERYGFKLEEARELGALCASCSASLHGTVESAVDADAAAETDADEQVERDAWRLDINGQFGESEDEA